MEVLSDQEDKQENKWLMSFHELIWIMGNTNIVFLNAMKSPSNSLRKNKVFTLDSTINKQ